MLGGVVAGHEVIGRHVRHEGFEIGGLQAFGMVPKDGCFAAGLFADLNDVRGVCAGCGIRNEERLVAILGDEVLNSLDFLVVVAIGGQNLILNIVLGVCEQDAAVGFLCPELIVQRVHQDAQMPGLFLCEGSERECQHEGQYECKNLFHSLSSFFYCKGRCEPPFAILKNHFT